VEFHLSSPIIPLHTSLADVETTTSPFVSNGEFEGEEVALTVDAVPQTVSLGLLVQAGLIALTTTEFAATPFDLRWEG
jgi:hypothetical protein